MIQIGRMAGSV